MAAHKLNFLYHTDTNKAGFKLKKRPFGPGYKDTKKILKFTKDEYTRQRAEESLRLWKISFKCLYLAFAIWKIVIIFQ